MTAINMCYNFVGFGGSPPVLSSILKIDDKVEIGPHKTGFTQGRDSQMKFVSQL